MNRIAIALTDNFTSKKRIKKTSSFHSISKSGFFKENTPWLVFIYYLFNLLYDTNLAAKHSLEGIARAVANLLYSLYIVSEIGLRFRRSIIDTGIEGFSSFYNWPVLIA